MSDAAIPFPPLGAAPQTGDVLTSIRRMIAHEDDRPTASGVLRLDAAAAVPGDDWHESSVRHEVRPTLTDQTWAEAGRAPGLSAAAAVATVRPSTNEPDTPDWPADRVLCACTLPADAAPRAAAALPACEENASSPVPRADLPSTAVIQSETRTTEHPAQTPAQAPVQAEIAMTMHNPTQAAPLSLASGPAEDSFIASLIRDALRHELNSNPDGRVSRELRTVILQEVARALSADAASSRT